MRIKPLCLTLALSLGFALPGFNASAADAAMPLATATAKASKLVTVEGITEYSLPNGMRVLLAPDASKPTTTVNLTYLVGSRHENYGETGMAHLLEHMTFKGTPSQGNIMQELGRRGMDFNGTTFMDRTNYYETFPSSEASLEWALAMEADRMVNSSILKSELDKEFSVVRNEMEIGENDPHQVLWKQLTAVTYDWHNYGHNTIGARSDVENVKIDKLQAFYRKYYQPDNAVLVVSGKFDPATTLAVIEKHFGAIAKPARTLEPTYTIDAQRDGARELTIKRIADTQLAAALYPTAAGAHADSAAIAVLGHILASSPSGRLHKSMVEAKKAVSVANWALDLAEPGYIIFWAELSKQQSLPEVRTLMLKQIEGMKSKPVTAAELARAKASLLNDIDKTINSAQELGLQLSESIAKGDWRLFFLNRDRIEAMTLAEVQRAAENYFKESNRSFGQFIPVKAADRASIPATPDVGTLLAGYQGRAAVAEGEAFDVSPANIEQRTQRLTLANGMKLALTPKKTRAGALAGHIVLEFGEAQSLFGHSAHADMTADMLMMGAGKLSRAEINARLDKLKTKLEISGKGQSVNVRFDTIRKNLPEVLALIGEILHKPSFPASEFEQLRNANLAQIEAGRNEPTNVGSRELEREFNQFKKGDIRYRNSDDESAALYKAATLADVKHFYDSMYGANNGMFALVGDFDAREVAAQAKSLFGSWNSRAGFVRLDNPVPGAKAISRKIETPDKANAFYLAQLPLAMQDDSPDYAAMSVVEKVIGGGTESRLMARLRQKDGLSYGVGSQFSASSLEPHAKFTLYAMYAPQNLEKLKLGFKEELDKFVRDGMTEQELGDAKKSLMQERQNGRAQDDNLAAAHIGNFKAKRTFARAAELDAQIQNLTLGQVNAAIKKYLQPGKFLHVYAGDFAGTAKKAASDKAANMKK